MIVSIHVPPIIPKEWETFRKEIAQLLSWDGIMLSHNLGIHPLVLASSLSRIEGQADNVMPVLDTARQNRELLLSEMNGYLALGVHTLVTSSGRIHPHEKGKRVYDLDVFTMASLIKQEISRPNLKRTIRLGALYDISSSTSLTRISDLQKLGYEFLVCRYHQSIAEHGNSFNMPLYVTCSCQDAKNRDILSTMRQLNHLEGVILYPASLEEWKQTISQLDVFRKEWV